MRQQWSGAYVFFFRRSFIALVMLCVFCVLEPVFDKLRCEQLRQLIDGKPIKVVGVIALEYAGNHHYLVVRPDHPYEAIFDRTDHRKVSEIGLSLDGQWEAMKILVGHKVTVFGVMQLEPTSPYYLNGTLIVARSIELSDGSLLLPRQRKTEILPQSMKDYFVRVTFRPHNWNQFSFDVRDGRGLNASSTSTYISCSLNGPGDVMNCFCPDNFAFSGTGHFEDDRFIRTAEPDADFSFAQFVLPDPVRSSFRSEWIECARVVSSK